MVGEPKVVRKSSRRMAQRIEPDAKFSKEKDLELTCQTDEIPRSWSLHVDERIKAAEQRFLLDKGVSRSVIRPKLVEGERVQGAPTLMLRTASRATLPIKGQVTIKFRLGKTNFRHNFLVAEVTNDYILGLDLHAMLEQMQCNGVIKPAKGSWSSPMVLVKKLGTTMQVKTTEMPSTRWTTGDRSQQGSGQVTDSGTKHIPLPLREAATEKTWPGPGQTNVKRGQCYNQENRFLSNPRVGGLTIKLNRHSRLSVVV